MVGLAVAEEADINITATDIKSAIVRGMDELKASGVATARLDARLLLAAAMKLSPEALLIMQPQHLLTAQQEQVFASYIKRRGRREPVSHIVGSREFWSMEFAVSPAVLDPRPDSETLIEAVLEFAKTAEENISNILDIGTGSGCLLLAVLSELPAARGVGVDISLPALQIAEYNARKHGMSHRARFVYDDWGKGLAGGFDIIISNPPYIASAEIVRLQPEVRDFEPIIALDGGTDGLSCYRSIMPVIKSRLDVKGRAFVEIGAGQERAVTEIAADCGLAVIAAKTDLAGITRCLILR